MLLRIGSSLLRKPPKSSLKLFKSTMTLDMLDATKLKEIDGWQKLWNDNIIPWHKEDVHPKLLSHLDLFGPSRGRFFVPLCGKSKDLLFLYQNGFTVVGCDAIPNAAEEFFHEHKLDFKVDQKFPQFHTYSTQDEKLHIICGDYFDLTPEVVGGRFDSVWDRGSLVAVDVDHREKYAQVMKTLVNDKFCYLLATMESEHESPTHMPHSVSFSQVAQLFGNTFTIHVLDQKQTESDNGWTRDNTFLLLPDNESAQDRMEFWRQRWVDSNTRWHQNQVNPHLLRYLDKLTRGREKVSVFLPLCGKSLDLAWLYKQGHKVVGLEGVPLAVEAVFLEAGLEFVKEFVPEIEGFVYKTSDENLTIYACDFFKLRPEILDEKIDCVFDRGAFEAINVEERAKYVEHIFKLLKSDFSYILNGYEYHDEVFHGPPFCVERNHVFDLFDKKLFAGNSHKLSTVTLLDEEDYHNYGKEKFGVNNMKKLTYIIQ